LVYSVLSFFRLSIGAAPAHDWLPMILRQQVLAGLHAKRAHFRAFNDEIRSETETYDEALGRLAQMRRDELDARLASTQTPGALPTREFDRAPNLRINFAQRWSNHEEARQWASAILLDHPVFAVDGSQIPPSSDLALPVAAVQIAWFDNRHTRDGRYTKDAALDLLGPDELLSEFDGERQISEQPVNLRRFAREAEAIKRWMEDMAAETPERMPLALFDGSLVISFADRLQEQMRAAYVDAVLDLLRTSERTRIPLVGYVDSSNARDLVHMLANCFELREAERIDDARISGAGMQWGDRTPFFVCARGSADRRQPGVLERFAEYRRGVGFVYLKTNSASPPARLDVPHWVFEAGLLDETLDLVRAEVIVGNGYPYALEAADAAAVLTARDREAFRLMVEKFAEREGITARVSQKAVSKSRRR
jgi:hypothetical protein